MTSLTHIKHAAKRIASLIQKHLPTRSIRLLINRYTRKLRKLLKYSVRKSWLPISVIAVIVLLALFFTPMFSGKIVKSVPVAFTTKKVKDPTLELGTTEMKQTGVNGMKQITYSEPKSLFNLIFGGGVQSKLTEKSSTTTKQPVREVINSGTKRYQYMYCSNGTYRYYTDTQFKNPSVGFTHKSPDDCAKNNAGTEAQLANSPPQSTKNTAPFTPLSSSFTLPNCTTTSIPYGVDYENVSWLPVGQTETYPGINGTYFSCLGTTVQPLNETVYTGTGQNYNAEAQQAATQLARQKCTDEYNSAMAQIDADGAGGSSATIELKQLYNQCLDAAG